MITDMLMLRLEKYSAAEANNVADASSFLQIIANP